MRVRRSVTAGAAALAVCGVLGMAPAAAQAGSAPDPAWTKQAPAVHPPARYGAAMAYDAATRTVVLFGGSRSNGRDFGDTWTWDGTTWTKQAPAVHPPARTGAAMAYDAATGTVVLSGGTNSTGEFLNDTWTWDGTTWTQQPGGGLPFGAVMAYDAATGTVVSFDNGFTATWDGTTWTPQAPATSPSPRTGEAMAYDAATGTVVLFGGYHGFRARVSTDTWTWDGTTWTKQAHTVHPSKRVFEAMAYDAATGTVVLFGGSCCVTFGRHVYGTWTWDGTTWTKQATPVHPSARSLAPMAYDAATGTVVLFGGLTNFDRARSDTWTWG